jgi:hypothetical protein
LPCAQAFSEDSKDQERVREACAAKCQAAQDAALKAFAALESWCGLPAGTIGSKENADHAADSVREPSVVAAVRSGDRVRAFSDAAATTRRFACDSSPRVLVCSLLDEYDAISAARMSGLALAADGSEAVTALTQQLADAAADLMEMQLRAQQALLRCAWRVCLQ